MRVQAFFSSSALHLMYSTMSGWSTFRITILAARRVRPPDLMTPANASKPFMKETGPDAVPPPWMCSFEERRVEKFVPVPEPHLKRSPSVLARLRIELAPERGKPPWIVSRLQAFFGMRAAPTIAACRVPLVLPLLAPIQRAVQVTTDFA